MKFTSYGKQYNNISYESLLDYVSQIVLSKSDEDLKEKTQIYEEEKKLFFFTKSSLKLNKEKLLISIKELARVRLILSILSIIDTLRKESVLFGDRKRKVTILLNELKSKSFGELKVIETNLKLAIPNNSKVTNY